VDLASCQDKRFCDRMEPLTQQLLVNVKAARVRVGGVDGAEVQPHLVKVKSAYGAKNSLKRGMSFLEKGGKRTSKKARGENVPVSGPPLKGANAKGPARPTLLQQLVKRAGKGGLEFYCLYLSSSEWCTTVHEIYLLLACIVLFDYEGDLLDLALPCCKRDCL